MRMAKKVCEDWASLLLNEKTTLTIEGAKESDFLQGNDGESGILGQLHFWPEANALVEKAFYSGTGAFILKIDGMQIQDGFVAAGESTKIRIEYLPAQCIIPLTVQGGDIIEAAFISEVIQNGKTYLYLEEHCKEPDGYVIKNRYFRNDNNQMEEVPLPAGIAPVFRTRSPYPLFAIVRPNIVNPYDYSLGMGVSVFAGAIDNLKGVDLAYNNFCRDFELGGKKVFYNESLIKDCYDAQGNLFRVVPDETLQQLFIKVGEPDLDDKNPITEFNPTLRVTENIDGIQAHLDYLSFKCGLGTKHYQFNAGSIVTATQYSGDKQELVQNASKHCIVLANALQRIMRAILWAGKNVMNLPLNPEASIAVNFDDGYIIDAETERMRDLQEVRDGLMQRWEYRVKWYGEDEAKAKRMIGAQQTNDELMGFKKVQNADS